MCSTRKTIATAMSFALHPRIGTASPASQLSMWDMHNLVETYVPREWTEVAPMHTARHHHSSAVVDGAIYVIGGYDETKYLDTVERYDPRNDVWTSVAPIHSARHYHSSAVVDGVIYVMGGHDGTKYLTTAERYA